MSCHSIWYPLDTGNYPHWCFRYLSPVTGAPVSAYSPSIGKISVNPPGTIHWKPNTGHHTNPLPRHRLAEDKQNQLLFPTLWFKICNSDTFHVLGSPAPFDDLYVTPFFLACQHFFEKNFHPPSRLHKKRSRRPMDKPTPCLSKNKTKTSCKTKQQTASCKTK